MQLNQDQVHCLLVAAANRRMCERAWLLDALTVCDKYTHELQSGEPMSVGKTIKLEDALISPEIAIGDVVRLNEKFLGIVTEHDNGEYTVVILQKHGTPIFHVQDVLEPSAGELATHFGRNPIAGAWGLTNVGRVLINIIAYQYPTDFAVFPFYNEEWTDKSTLKRMSHAVQNKQVTVEQWEQFLNYCYFVCHMTELTVPSFTEKSLQPAPGALEFKRKFIAEHKGQLNDPLVIQKLEAELIKMDKAYLGDDPSTILFDGLGKKSYDVQRKKMFYTVGGIAPFGTMTGEVDFIENSLLEGWTIPSIPSRANEIRKGSYERGVETAKGGAETKSVLRAFGDIAITEDDCGTKRTIEIDCSIFDGKQFIGRTIQVGSSDVVVTEDNLDQYVTGKKIKLYSPLTCATKHNMCYKCCGRKSKELNARFLGSQIIKITSKFMNQAMKNMHGTALAVRSNRLQDILL